MRKKIVQKLNQEDDQQCDTGIILSVRQINTIITISSNICRLLRIKMINLMGDH